MSAIHTVKPCGCEWTHDEQTKWCAHHVSGLTETIKARERSITDLRYRVRELEAHLLASHGCENVDHWKNPGTRYCCYHMRWETREGAEA